jgi:hypothetical protein
MTELTRLADGARRRHIVLVDGTVEKDEVITAGALAQVARRGILREQFLEPTELSCKYMILNNFSYSAIRTRDA